MILSEALACLRWAIGIRKSIAAAHQQLDLMPLSSRTFFNEAAVLLAERLAKIAPGDLQFTFFSNSGAEAVEAALKFARIASGKTDFVSTLGSYHGKTLGALSVTGREKYRTAFEPLIPGVAFVPYNDLNAAVERHNRKDCRADCRTDSGRGRNHSRRARLSVRSAANLRRAGRSADCRRDTNGVGPNRNDVRLRAGKRRA